MRAGLMRVLGVAVEAGAATAAAVLTDGARLAGLGESATAPLGPDPEAAVAALLARFAPADLIGIEGGEAVSGALLAAVLGVPVVAELGAADRAMGGQGGPLAPFFLHALARHLGWRAPVALLDLGARACLTWIDTAEARPEAACLAFEAGPGADGAAPGGRIDDAMLHAFVQHPYFARVPPKWLDAAGPAVETAHLDPADAAATRAAALAAAVVLGLSHLPRPPGRLVVTGPGRLRPDLLAVIAAGADLPVVPAEAAGIDPGLIGAQTAAHLAARTLRGLPTSAPATTGARAAVGGGAISRPGAPPT